MTHFELERGALWLLKASPWLFAGLALLGGALPFIPDDRPGNPLGLAVVSTVCALLFGTLAWYSFRTARRLHLMPICADDEGLWPTALPRSSSLIRWTEVSRLRERPTLQRLERLSASDAVLVRLEYQLRDFESLRALVLARARLDTASSIAPDGVYAMPRSHHAFSIGGALGFAVLGWYIVDTDPWLGYGGANIIVALIAWEYWTLPYRFQLTAHSLELDFPGFGRHRSIARGLVSDVRITDDRQDQIRRPFVIVEVRDSKPVQFKGFRLPPVELFRVLRDWQSGQPGSGNRSSSP